MSDSVLCVVEIPKGTRNKYEWDDDLQAIKLDRFLFSSVVYPGDYGFIPETCAADGDPLDVLIVVTEPTFPGCRIEFRPVGLLDMHDEKGHDEKVLGVPVTDPNWGDVRTLDDLQPSLREEIEHFFSIYKQPEGKRVDMDGWLPREAALEAIDTARSRWRERRRSE